MAEDWFRAEIRPLPYHGTRPSIGWFNSHRRHFARSQSPDPGAPSFQGLTKITVDVSREKFVDIGEIEITKENEHTVNWQPYVGIGIMVIGGTILILRKKRPLST
jgi:hypothetical protein